MIDISMSSEVETGGKDFMTAVGDKFGISVNYNDHSDMFSHEWLPDDRTKLTFKAVIVSTKEYERLLADAENLKIIKEALSKVKLTESKNG